jgi:hypothetical protein
MESVMLDQSLDRQKADLDRAPAATPATATIIPDAARAGQDDEPESPPPPDAPEINPELLPETSPDLQPDIPPVENPSI